jgi:hypothetical protein
MPAQAWPMPQSNRILREDLDCLRNALKPLVGTPLRILSRPVKALKAFEPSQVGTIVGTLMDACIPHLDDIPKVGLTKHEGILGDR